MDKIQVLIGQALGQRLYAKAPEVSLRGAGSGWGSAPFPLCATRTVRLSCEALGMFAVLQKSSWTQAASSCPSCKALGRMPEEHLPTMYGGKAVKGSRLSWLGTGQAGRLTSRCVQRYGPQGQLLSLAGGWWMGGRQRHLQTINESKVRDFPWQALGRCASDIFPLQGVGNL